MLLRPRGRALCFLVGRYERYVELSRTFRWMTMTGKLFVRSSTQSDECTWRYHLTSVPIVCGDQCRVRNLFDVESEERPQRLAKWSSHCPRAQPTLSGDGCHADLLMNLNLAQAIKYVHTFHVLMTPTNHPKSLLFGSVRAPVQLSRRSNHALKVDRFQTPVRETFSDHHSNNGRALQTYV